MVSITKQKMNGHNLYNYSLDFIYTKSTSVVEFELGWSGRNIQNRAKSKYISFKS